MTSDPDPQDPLWDVLRQARPRRARGSFVDDTVRAVRLSRREPWWRKVWLPVSLGGLVTAATAVMVITWIGSPASRPQPPAAAVAENEPSPESLDALEDWVKAETLSVAAEHPAEFTDAELVLLIVD